MMNQKGGGASIPRLRESVISLDSRELTTAVETAAAVEPTEETLPEENVHLPTNEEEVVTESESEEEESDWEEDEGESSC